MLFNPSSNTSLTAAAATGQLPRMVDHVKASHHQYAKRLQSVKSGVARGPLNNVAGVLTTDTEKWPFSQAKEIIASAAGPHLPTVMFDNTKEGPETLCIICWDVKPSWMCVPCGHIAMCRACSQAVKEETNACPVCQQAIWVLQEVSTAE